MCLVCVLFLQGDFGDPLVKGQVFYGFFVSASSSGFCTDSALPVIVTDVYPVADWVRNVTGATQALLTQRSAHGAVADPLYLDYRKWHLLVLQMISSLSVVRPPQVHRLRQLLKLNSLITARSPVHHFIKIPILVYTKTQLELI